MRLPKARETAASSVVDMPCAREIAAKAVVDMSCTREVAAKAVVRLVEIGVMPAVVFRHLACAGGRIEPFPCPMSNDSASTAGGAPALDPVTVLAALANDVRWQAMTMMAGGTGISASDLAAASGRDVDSAGKHLRVLRAAGAADWRAGRDTRFTLYFIPEKFRPQPGVVDYGFCRLQFTPPTKRPAHG